MGTASLLCFEGLSGEEQSRWLGGVLPSAETSKRRIHSIGPDAEREETRGGGAQLFTGLLLWYCTGLLAVMFQNAPLERRCHSTVLVLTHPPSRSRLYPPHETTPTANLAHPNTLNSHPFDISVRGYSLLIELCPIVLSTDQRIHLRSPTITCPTK